MKDQYRKKPVIIDAYQLPAVGEDVPDSFHEWCQKVGFDTFESGRDETLIIPTLEGEMTAAPGDWIIRGVKGEFYPCKPDIFAATYEPAEAEPLNPDWCEGCTPENCSTGCGRQVIEWRKAAEPVHTLGGSKEEYTRVFNMGRDSVLSKIN